MVMAGLSKPFRRLFRSLKYLFQAFLVTDGDQELISAITQTLPSIQRQRCIFHLNNNVILYIKRHWKQPRLVDLDEDGDDIVSNDAIGSLDNEEDIIALVGSNIGGDGQSTTTRFDKVPDEVTNTCTGLFLLWQHMVYSLSFDHFDWTWALL